MITDGILSGTALVLILRGWFGDRPITLASMRRL